MASEETDENQVDYRCGICKRAVFLDNNQVDHSCFQRYSSVCIDKFKHLYPQLDDGSIIVPQSLSTTEDLQNQCPNRRASIPKSTSKSKGAGKRLRCPLSDDQVELLIAEVEKREPLWNFRIEASERESTIITQLWEEIATCEGLNGLVNGTQARAKFKSLKDFFRKIVTAEKLPSGSESKSTSDWKFYKMMNFTKNFLLNEPTDGNISDEQPNDVASQSLETVPEKSCTPAKKTKKTNESTSPADAILQLAKTFEKDDPIQPAPVLDEVDGMLTTVGAYVRAVPQKVYRIRFAKDISDFAFEKLQEYANFDD